MVIWPSSWLSGSRSPCPLLWVGSDGGREVPPAIVSNTSVPFARKLDDITGVHQRDGRIVWGAEGQVFQLQLY